MCVASAKAFSSSLAIISLIKPLTFAEGSSPLEVSVCIAEATRDASCAKSSEYSLLARFSNLPGSLELGHTSAQRKY